MVRTPVSRFPASLLWLSLTLFVLTAIFVNPFREIAVEDDFSYAWTVAKLIDTGEYTLHPWASANPVVHVYWGGLVSRVLGSHFGGLRISTLIIAFLALLALYGLAREHGLSDFTAGLVTLVLASSPLFVFLSFSFMTDVPFLAWLIIALFLYTRALRLRSYGWMIVASVACAAAILSRQFAMALVAGLGLLWMLDGCKLRQLPFFLVGLLIPVLAAGWQLYQGILEPTWGMKYASAAQMLCLSKPRALCADLFYRPAIILQYMVLFSMPLALWLMVASPLLQRKGPGALGEMPGRKAFYFMLACAVYVVVVLVRQGRLMPVWGWTLQDLRALGVTGQAIVTLITAAGAVLYAGILFHRYVDAGSWKQLPNERRLLDLATFFLLAFHLIFFQIGDQYLLCLMPFTLIAVGGYLEEHVASKRSIAIGAAIVLMVVSGLWTRERLDRDETIWKAADFLLSKGVEARDISASFQWNLHHRFFDYLSETGHLAPANVWDLLKRWLPEQEGVAHYLVRDALSRLPQPAPGLAVPSEAQALDTKGLREGQEVVEQFPYRGFFLEKRFVTITKKSAEESGQEAR